ncbi:PAS domain-containing protein [Egicoccus sp. AB-alg2]|uniref:PAS domain-containing protein n=1 Tax=Egicoccus sp. AB-alg2 TaxID=3242693 RepID=UPI00359D620C
MEEIAEAATALFHALADGAAVFELLPGGDDLRVVVANAAAAAVFQLPEAQLRGRLGSELYPPDELADVLRRARDTLAAGGPVSYRAVREQPYGRRVVEATMIPFGRERVVVHGRDISERAEALRRLDELERLADIGSWGWNVADGTVTWSRQYRRILGIADDEPASIPRVLDLVHPDDRDRVLGRIDVVGSGRDIVRGITYRIVRPSGEVRVVQSRGEVVTDADARPVRVFGTMQDVTEQQRAEQACRQLDRALARQRQALELNDNVVQGLSAAWLAFELGQHQEGIDLVQRTTLDAQGFISRLLREAAEDEPLQPGALARVAPANVDHPEGG